MIAIPALPAMLFNSLTDDIFWISHFGTWSIGLSSIIYYGALSYLLYKVFQQKKVAIKYPIIIILILIISYIGGLITAFGGHC